MAVDLSYDCVGHQHSGTILCCQEKNGSKIELVSPIVNIPDFRGGVSSYAFSLLLQRELEKYKLGKEGSLQFTFQRSTVILGKELTTSNQHITSRL